MAELTHYDLKLQLDRVEQRQLAFDKDVTDVKSALDSMNKKLDECLQTLPVHGTRIGHNEEAIMKLDKQFWGAASTGVVALLAALGALASSVLGL